MARTAITVQTIAVTGLAPTYANADQANGMYFANDGNVFLHIKNTNAATRVITVATPATVAGMAIAELTYTIAATTGDVMIGPFDTGVFNQSGGIVHVDFSADTNVTVAAIKLP